MLPDKAPTSQPRERWENMRKMMRTVSEVKRMHVTASIRKLTLGAIVVSTLFAGGSALPRRWSRAPRSAPSATTTAIPGNQLPAPEPGFGGVIRRDMLEGLEGRGGRPRIVPPKGRAQRSAHHDRRPGLWRQRHVWRRHPDAGAGPHREGGAALHRIQLHRAVLAHAGGADHRPQPPLGGLRRDHGAVDGFPGL